MARGNNGGGRGQGFRGRGQRGRGRGASPFRGQGQTLRGAGHPVYHSLDVDIQQWKEDSVTNAGTPPQQRGRGGKVNNFRGRGRGTGITTQNFVVYSNNSRTPPPPRTNGDSGYGTPMSRGRGRGGGLGSKFNPHMSLSKLLALDRPFLRPITFVPAQLTPVLFQEEEEILEVKPFIEPEDHVPTADRVTRIFSHQKGKGNSATQGSMFDNPVEDLFDMGDESIPIASVDFAALGDFVDTTMQAQGLDSKTHVISHVTDAISIKADSEQARTSVLSNATAIQATDSEHVRGQLNEVMFSAFTTGVGRPHSSELVVSSASDSTSAGFVTASESPNTADTLQIFLDPNPSSSIDVIDGIEYTSSSSHVPLGSVLPDDDTIVYDAPLPRSREQTPVVPTGSLPAAPLSTATHEPPPTSIASQNTDALNISFVRLSDVAKANREHLAAVKPRNARFTKKDGRKRIRGRGLFGSLGAALEEKHLHEDEDTRKQRREGSDIDWGTEEDSDSDEKAANKYNVEESDIDKVSSSFGAMEIDADIDVKAMQSFVQSMSMGGTEHTTMDDVEDDVRLQAEDEESVSDRSSESDEVDSEVEAIFNAELNALVGEEGEYGEKPDYEEDESSDEEEDEDEKTTPRRKWQAHLERVRQKAKGKERASPSAGIEGSPGGLFQARLANLKKQKQRAEDSEEDEIESGRDDFDEQFGWEDEEGDLVTNIQTLLDENDAILKKRSLKQRNVVFDSIYNGEFASSPAKKHKDKGKGLPDNLRVLWENDRVKKAENKRLRALARQQAALDPFAQHKGGKKGRKDLLTALRHANNATPFDDDFTIYDDDSSNDDDNNNNNNNNGVLRNPAPDIASLVMQIRLYLNDVGNRAPMSLPPMDKTSRAKVHEIAEAFHLKSKSKGKGQGRYTTLVKTSRSGLGVNERKVARIVKSQGEWGFTRADNRSKGGRGGGGGGGGAPRQKEGDEVGKAAPKIGEGNVGFKMLAGMGWAEGQRIGVSAPGLDVPLTAIIKNTKLGLGATR